MHNINALKTQLNPICHLLALLGAHHILHISRITVKPRSCRELSWKRNPVTWQPVLPQSGSQTASLMAAHTVILRDHSEVTRVTVDFLILCVTGFRYLLWCMCIPIQQYRVLLVWHKLLLLFRECAINCNRKAFYYGNLYKEGII
jgi:hypothetical protein